MKSLALGCRSAICRRFLRRAPEAVLFKILKLICMFDSLEVVMPIFVVKRWPSRTIYRVIYFDTNRMRLRDSPTNVHIKYASIYMSIIYMPVTRPTLITYGRTLRKSCISADANSYGYGDGLEQVYVRKPECNEVHTI